MDRKIIFINSRGSSCYDNVLQIEFAKSRLKVLRQSDLQICFSCVCSRLLAHISEYFRLLTSRFSNDTSVDTFLFTVKLISRTFSCRRNVCRTRSRVVYFESGYAKDILLAPFCFHYFFERHNQKRINKFSIRSRSIVISLRFLREYNNVFNVVNR